MRRTATTDLWQAFEGLNFSYEKDGRTEVVADYLPAPIVLEDKLSAKPDRAFTLIGRVTDQVKIAGKRGSLSEVNAVLSRFEGVLDGVVIFPEQDRPVPRLVAIVVLEGNYDKAALRAHFQKYVDPAFVPRPIYLVDNLPREETGKLVNTKLIALYQSLRAG